MSKKPKFRVGQVVAWVGDRKATRALGYYRIKSWYRTTDGEIRYTFGGNLKGYEEALCPVEEVLRPLTKRERGAA